MGKVLVTGAAGFIGFYVSQRLLNQGETVIGLDNLNDYYDVKLKYSRLSLLEAHPNFQFLKADLTDRTKLETLFAQYQFDHVVHLAAQAGVRYSIKDPHTYVDSNVVGFLHILEGCRHSHVKHLVYASSSSVYGANRTLPFSVHDNVDHPLSLYAATKKANELMAHTYSHLYQIPTTGLRFFTVYGPWGRPDMALFSFTKAILEKRPIDVYNAGKMRRDFTYVEDVAEAVARVLACIPEAQTDWSGHHPDPSSSNAPYRLYNLGNHQPIELLRFIEILETCLGVEAQKNLMPMQPGDVPETFADISDLADAINFYPNTSIEEGIAQFVAWYRSYYDMND